MQRISHIKVVIFRWFLLLPWHWLLKMCLHLAHAGRRVEINWSAFQQFHLLKLCRACTAQVAGPAVFNWIVLPVVLNWKNEIQSFGWYYRLILRFFHGRNLYMLLDANTMTGSCDCGKCVRCTIYSSLYYLNFYAPLPRRCALSIRFLRSVQFQGANSKEPSIHAYTHIRSWHWVASASVVAVNLLANALLTVTAVTPYNGIHWHGVLRPKQHPMTFSHTTPGCFGWNSSPT